MSVDSVVASVYSGLGNRLRVLLSAQEWARYCGADFAYYWPAERRFRADIERYWNFPVKRLGLPSYCLHRVTSRVVDSVEVVSSDFSALPRHLIYRSQQPVSGLPEEFDWREAFARMKLVPEIHDSAASYYLSHLADGPFVGVSVRANKFAHQKTLEASPVEWYIARMRELVAINPDLSFFLSCDDPSAQKYISDSVPRVFSLEKTGRYNSVEGVKEAVIDLYILSLASHILGPHWSSFVELSLACASSRTTFETSQQPPESVTLYPLPNKPLWWRG